MTTFRLVQTLEAMLEAWPRVAPHVEAIAGDDESYRPEDLRDELARGTHNLVLFEDGAELLGFAVLATEQQARRRYVRELHLWVMPEHRGKGLFAEYLNWLRAWAVAAGFDGTRVTLPVDAEPRWRPLMLEHSFAPRAVEYTWEARPCLG